MEIGNLSSQCAVAICFLLADAKLFWAEKYLNYRPNLWIFRSFNSFDPFFVGVRRDEGASHLLCMNTFLLTGVHVSSDRGRTVHYTDID